MSPVLLLCLCLRLGGDPAPDAWLAEDKLKHFAASFVVTTLAAGGARAAGMDAQASALAGAGVGAALGAWKEVRDARRPDARASIRDAAWDAAGVGAAAALMSRVR